nr:alpha/beta hydrolase [uncultured Campylobacter sp.]
MKYIAIYIHEKTEAQQKRPATDGFLQIAACLNLIMEFDYEARTPWEAKEEFAPYFESILKSRKSATIVANGIGAFFAMHALQGIGIKKAYFISPIVNMENLILNMMSQANASEQELRDKGELSTKFGEKLSWRYLCYVREHSTLWTAPTHILYGENDDLTSFETICEFANGAGATLTVMKNGEHRFSTAEQMHFLDGWILRHS